MKGEREEKEDRTERKGGTEREGEVGRERGVERAGRERCVGGKEIFRWFITHRF